MGRRSGTYRSRIANAGNPVWRNALRFSALRLRRSRGRLADEGPEGVVHRDRAAGQVREMAVEQRQLLVGILGAGAAERVAVQRRNEPGAVGPRFAVHQQRLWRVADDVEDLGDLLAGDDTVRRYP